MHNFTLQELVRIDSATATYTQPDSGWTGVAPFQDLVFSIDVRAYTPIGAGAVLTLYLETAPEREDSLFKPMVAAGIDLVSVAGGVAVVKVLLSQNPDVSS